MGTKKTENKKTENKKTDNKKTPARDLAIDPNTGNVVEPVKDPIVEHGVSDNTMTVLRIIEGSDRPLNLMEIMFIATKNAETLEDVISHPYTAKTLPRLVSLGVLEIVSVTNPVTNKEYRSAHYVLTPGAMDRVNQGQVNRASRPTRTRSVTAVPMDPETYRKVQEDVDNVDALLTTIRNLTRRDEDTDEKSGPVSPIRTFLWDGVTHQITSREFQTIVQGYRKGLVTPEYRARRAVIVGEFNIGGSIVTDTDTDNAVAS